MAGRSCDCHGAPIQGRRSTAYPRLLGEELDEGGRRTLCDRGLSDLLDCCSRFLHTRDESDTGGVAVFGSCGVCGEDRVGSDGAAVFVTCYPRGGDRQDFRGYVCQEHLGAVVPALILS